jgi:hypothetical protein
MESTKAEEPGKHIPEKVLPRGLEQISHLFLSQSSLNEAVVPAAPGIPCEQASRMDEVHPLSVVSREFLGRDQLITFLGSQPSALEAGMRLIDRNVRYESSDIIELLALDCTNQLSIIDLDISPNDALLLRGLGHFDWVVRNHQIVSRMYRDLPINASLQPRLILVAPDFSPLFRTVVRLITVPRILCLRYRAVGMAGETGVFFERACP